MNTLPILNQEIRTVDGLYNLNDLHHASGDNPKHKPIQQLTRWLADNGYIFRRSANWVPYLEAQKQGFLAINSTAVPLFDEVIVTYHCMLTAKGVSYLAQRLKAEGLL